jgi:hypothetical protein
MIRRPFYPVLPLVFVWLAGVLAGCSGEESAPPGEAVYADLGEVFQQDIVERDSVLAAFSGADIEPMRQAFTRLANSTFTRYTRTEQLDRNEFLVAYRERLVRHTGLPGSRRFDVLDQDSSGTFDYGFFERFVSANVEKQDPRDLAPFLLPDAPAFLSGREFDAYLYRFQPDTLMGGVLARVVEARARPVEGDGRNIRRVRYFVDRETNALVGISLERIDLALFFREESRYFAHLQQSESGWVPMNTRFESLIVMPFRPPQLFRTVASYRDVAPVRLEVPS